MGNNKKVEIGFKFQVSSFKNGLTLIELLVAVTMFSSVMAAVVGIFTATVRGQARSLASQQLLNQTSFCMEYTGRALRMAKKDTAGTCTGTANLNYVKTRDGNGIKFLNYQDECQEFYWATTTDTSKLKEKIGSRDAVELTSDKLEVISFNIGPDDSWEQGDTEQPRVTIFLDIKGKGEGVKPVEQPRIKIQTMVSQRNLDTTE